MLNPGEENEAGSLGGWMGLAQFQGTRSGLCSFSGDGRID